MSLPAKLRRRARWAACTFAAASVLAILWCRPAYAASREAQVKAAYLFKLPAFVEWPTSAFANDNAPLILCISGRRDILSVLTQISAGQRIQDRAVTVRELNPRRPEAAAACHAVYLGSSDSASRMFAAAVNGPLLLIGEEGSGARGCTIEFAERGDSIRLIVHRGAAAERRLTLSSKLMAVAAAVRP